MLLRFSLFDVYPTIRLLDILAPIVEFHSATVERMFSRIA